MNEQKIVNALKFYLLATELKDKIRSGWKIWNIERKRIESVAEHIYGTCILAISIDSEFKFDLDLRKTIMMLVLHELEEVIIGDLTPFDKITPEERRKIGEEAVLKVLSSLTKKEEYFDLLLEFEEQKTFEAQFSRMCDKLECDIQIKLYCEEGVTDLYAKRNKHLLEFERIKKRIEIEKPKTLADLFIENDRDKYSVKEFIEILNFVKNNDLLKFK